MSKYHKNKKAKEKEIAKERVTELFKQAGLAKTKSLSNRYVTIARKISMKFKVRIPLELKRKFCKHCYSYFRLGTTVRIRLHKGHKNYFCMKCEKFTRIPYK